MRWTGEKIKDEAQMDPEFRKWFTSESKRIDIAVELSNLRKESGLTQRELAEKVGKAQSTIVRIETGQMLPSSALINDIAFALGKQVEIKFF
jgi:DNA-binding XRE family transcriptional regulator